MRLKLLRYGHGFDSTLGRLRIEGEERQRCYTLEDEHRLLKLHSETRVPEGEYEIKLRREGGFHARYAKRFGDMHHGMLWLQNVPGFEYILLHCGNTDEDTAGCILVGLDAAIDADGEFSISSSTAAYRGLYPVVAAALLRGERVTIAIESWPYGPNRP